MEIMKHRMSPGPKHTTNFGMSLYIPTTPPFGAPDDAASAESSSESSPSIPSFHRPSSPAIASPACLPLASAPQLGGGSLPSPSDDVL